MDGISPGLRARLLLNRQDFHTAHALGQNFLLDEALLSGLLDLSGVGPEDAVLEIGPGAGVMTCLLADRARRVVAVELDRRLEPILREMLEGKENVRVVFADALKADLGEIMGEPFRVVANLPYYITADAVRKFLGSGYPIRSVHIMVQKEAAERMLARPGEKQWCLLAALAQYYARVRLLAEVPPEAFEPQPHVMSAFLELELYEQRPVRPREEQKFLRLLSAGFAMRRKTLANNLSASFGLSKEDAREALLAAGLDARVRGEALTLEEFCRLSDSMD